MLKDIMSEMRKTYNINSLSQGDLLQAALYFLSHEIILSTYYRLYQGVYRDYP